MWEGYEVKKAEAISLIEHEQCSILIKEREGIIELIELQAEVVEAAKKLSKIYDNNIDTNNPELYSTWRRLDDALAALDKHHG